MPKKTIYPVLSDSKIETLLKEFESKQIDFDSVITNDGNIALNMNIIYDHSKEHVDNNYVNNCLGIMGFVFKPGNELDVGYRNNTKYYTFAWKQILWLAIGDNCYGGTNGRILMMWDKKYKKPKVIVCLHD
jgi:hypothetical protein